MTTPIKITVAKGDGIGPEIMDATMEILRAAGAPIEPVFIDIGAKVYERGVSSGIEPGAWDLLRETRVFLKAPITTPQGGGYKSLNVTVRKSLGLYSNVRPVRSLYPFVETKHPVLDMVIIRENEEDLYAGIEHQQTGDVVQSLKLISRPGTEKIVRYAFEYARQYNRKKVTCMTKDNIMKHADGMFHKIFDEIGAEYPEIEKEHIIIDIGAALLADRPFQFDVVCTLNLYGDIISDIVAQISGSVGLAGSANIGVNMGMFEAIHGSAPDIAGKGIANPSGLLNGAVMMLVHMGLPEAAAKISNAWLCAIEEGVHTGDIYKSGVSKKKVGTKEFAQAVVDRLGRSPGQFRPVDFGGNTRPLQIPAYKRKKVYRQLVGVDVFLCDETEDPQALGDALTRAAGSDMKLKLITNRGVKVYPDGMPETFLTDHWRCRFVHVDANPTGGPGGQPTYPPIKGDEVIELLGRIHSAGLEPIKTENLYYLDGERGFSLGQGE
ncbi:MAG: NADP-dependent isocitrate dehydrogenase [bacterium]|nr:NADP-dependent isocitrate dehydrogenase [bacterium]